MLNEQEIRQALNASRSAPLSIANPHGPFGWEHLAQTLNHLLDHPDSGKKVSLEIPAETWQRLKHLADQATRAEARPVSVSELAAAILQHYVG
jgi:hypothetical protein